MHLEFTEKEQEFREEVRRFLRERLPPDIRGKVLSGCELARDDYLMWQRRLFERGWGAPGWPVPFGGAGWNAVQQYIFEDEAALAGAPRLIPFGLKMVAPVLMAYGTPAQQFGQPIGRFQVLQHRVADMAIHLEQARSMGYLAALRCTSADIGERRRALSAAKVVIGDAGRFIGQQAVQLHGGMGMTDDLQVSHWFKRLTAIGIMFGDSDAHLQRYAALSAAPRF